LERPFLLIENVLSKNGGQNIEFSFWLCLREWLSSASIASYTLVSSSWGWVIIVRVTEERWKVRKVKWTEMAVKYVDGESPGDPAKDATEKYAKHWNARRTVSEGPEEGHRAYWEE
jgi:hypothetical protein